MVAAWNRHRFRLRWFSFLWPEIVRWSDFWLWPSDLGWPWSLAFAAYLSRKYRPRYRSLLHRSNQPIWSSKKITEILRKFSQMNFNHDSNGQPQSFAVHMQHAFINRINASVVTATADEHINRHMIQLRVNEWNERNEREAGNPSTCSFDTQLVIERREQFRLVISSKARVNTPSFLASLAFISKCFRIAHE